MKCGYGGEIASFRWGRPMPWILPGEIASFRWGRPMPWILPGEIASFRWGRPMPWILPDVQGPSLFFHHRLTRTRA